VIHPEAGTAKHETPASVRANVRNTSECGTEKNHLCPTIDQVPSPLWLALVSDEGPIPLFLCHRHAHGLSAARVWRWS
jgi:hypothetical protein